MSQKDLFLHFLPPEIAALWSAVEDNVDAKPLFSVWTLDSLFLLKILWIFSERFFTLAPGEGRSEQDSANSGKVTQSSANSGAEVIE